MNLLSILGIAMPALFTVSAIGWGAILLQKTGIKELLVSEEITLKFMTGAGMLGTVIFMLGLAGWLTLQILWPLFVMGIFLFLSLKQGQRYSLKRLDISSGGATLKILLFVTFVIIVLAILKLRVPPVTTDELSYHLYLPKYYLSRERIYYLYSHVNSAFPLIQEMFYLFGIMLKSPEAIKSINFVMGIMTGVGIFAIGKKHFPEINPWFAPLIYLAVPIINHQMGLTKNDLALTGFLTGSFLCLFNWIDTKSQKWLILTGVLSGLAMGVKYLALFAIFVQGMIIMIEIVAQKKKGADMIRSLLLFGVSIFAVSFIWYLRSYLWTGNPFYPYLTSWIGGTGLENPLNLENKGLGKGLAALILCPWNATFYPDLFGGMSNQWGPLILAFLPFYFMLINKSKKWNYLITILTVLFLLWFYSKQNLRFLLQALPFFCLAIAGVVHYTGKIDMRFKKITPLFLAAHLTICAGIALYQMRDDYRVALGMEKQEEYLSRKVPTYAMAMFVNAMDIQDMKILSQEHRAYYFDAEIVRERAYRRLTRYNVEFKDRERDFIDKLIKEGITHLLVKVADQNIAEHQALKNVIDTVGKRGGINLLHETRFREPSDNSEIAYKLYSIS